MREAGFVDVGERRFRWPVGGASEVGRWNLGRWYVLFRFFCSSISADWSGSMREGCH